MDNHIHHHVHYEGGGTLADVLTALQRIEQKLGDHAGEPAMQQRIDDLTSELKQRNDELAAVTADAQPKE